MRNLSIFMTTLVCGAAWAQTPDKKPAEKKPDEMAKPAAEKPPGPAPELKKEYESMIGSWKCAGKGTMMGKEMTSTGTYKAAWDLDGNVVVAHFEAKAAGMPGAHKGMDVYSYDPSSKMFVSIGFDNMGGSSQAKSKGMQGDSEEWTGTGTMMGKQMDLKWTVTTKGAKEVTIKGTMGTDTFEETCKK